MTSIDVLRIIEEGDKFLENGDCEEALERYDEAINIEKQCAKAWYKKGNTLSKINEDDKALEAYEEAVSIRPGYAEAWYEMGNVYSRLKRYEEALKAYEKVTKINSKCFEAHYKKGNIFSNLKRYEEALKAHEKVIEICGNRLKAGKKTNKMKLIYAKAWYKKGNILGNLKEDREALEAYKKSVEFYDEIINEEKDNVEALKGKRAAISKRDKYNELEESIRDNTKGWYKRGNILCDLDRYEEAVEIYKKAIKMSNDKLRADEKTDEIKLECAELCNSTGNALYNLKRYEEALRAYEEAIKLYEKLIADEKTDEIRLKCAETWYNKGNALDDLKRHEEALRAYEKALELDPKDAYFQNNKGATLYNLGRYEEALKAYEKTLELIPENAYVWNGKGAALYNLGRYEEALEAYEKAINLDREYASPYANLGELFFVHGDLENASENIDRAYNLDEKRTLALFIKGKIEIEKKKYDSAIKFFQKAAHSNLGNPLPLLWIAYAKYVKLKPSSESKNKKYEGEIFAIIRELERAYDLSKKYPEENLRSCILYFLGYFYYRSGDIFAAKERLEDCVKLESKVRKLKEFIKSESSMRILKELFRPESSVKPRTCELLNHIWTYKIKPSWWSWWLSSPLNRWTKRIVFFFLLIPIFSLLLYLVIPDSMLLIKGDLFVYAAFISGSISFIEKNLSAYALLVSLSLFLLLSPFITKIKVKEFEAELSSPPVFEPFISPSMIEEKLQRSSEKEST